MNLAPSPRSICVLTWLTILALGIFLLLGVALPWTQRMAQLDADIAGAADQLARYRRLVDSLPMLRQELERVRGNDAFKAFYFEAPTPALAGASLQGRVQEIVGAAGGQLISAQILPEQPEEVPPRIRVRTQIQGSTESLVEILHAIDEARPFLFVDQLSIRSSARPEEPMPENARRPIRRPRANPAGDLTIRLDVFGFALGGGA